MLVPIIDGSGNAVNICIAGQETLVDRSSVLADENAQEVMASNEARSGFFFQNCSTDGNDMWINELGDAATAASPCIRIVAGGVWSSLGYPVTVNAISVIGTAGDTFTAREW